HENLQKITSINSYKQKSDWIFLISDTKNNFNMYKFEENLKFVMSGELHSKDIILGASTIFGYNDTPYIVMINNSPKCTSIQTFIYEDRIINEYGSEVCLFSKGVKNISVDAIQVSNHIEGIIAYEEDYSIFICHF